MQSLIAVIGARSRLGYYVRKTLEKSPFKWQVVQIPELPSDPNEIRSALRGVYAAVNLIDYWDFMPARHQPLTNFIDAAQRAGVRHIVQSSLVSVIPLAASAPSFLNEAHLDQMYKDELYLKQSGLLYTFLEPSFYYENWAEVKTRGKDGALNITLPINYREKFAQYSIKDTGPAVETILEGADEYNGKRLALMGDYLSGDEVAARLQKLLHVFVRFTEAKGVKSPSKYYTSQFMVQTSQGNTQPKPGYWVPPGLRDFMTYLEDGSSSMKQTMTENQTTDSKNNTTDSENNTTDSEHNFLKSSA